LEKIPVRISKDEADEQQAHSMIPKIERYTSDTLKQALTEKSNTNAYGRKGTVHKCLWRQRKKEQTTNVCGKERKTKPQMLVANEKWLQTADTK